MMAKDENLKQVHKLAAVPEGADKVSNPLLFKYVHCTSWGWQRNLVGGPGERRI